MSRLALTDRASGVVVRYRREHPGELVHIDVQKLGRIPTEVAIASTAPAPLPPPAGTSATTMSTRPSMTAPGWPSASCCLMRLP
jgi:hypothetical protein